MAEDARGSRGELPDAVADPELIERVRGGNVAAYEELFLRHRAVAVRYARRLAGPERGEDLVSEAFTKILDLLQRGKGPDVAFRAYLLTTVRTGHLNALRTGRREDLVPEHEPATEALTVAEDPDSRFDRATVLQALTRLPERWQQVLWMTSVEGLGNEEVAARLDLTANAVASLAFRARAGLRQAFLAQHLQDSSSPACRQVLDRLPAHRRGALGPRARAQVDLHLPTCRSCSAAALELDEVDSRLGALVGPVGLTVLTAGLGAAAGAGNVGRMFATLKAALALLGTQAKAWAAGAPWVLGAKVALAATVAAAGVAVGAHALDNRPKPKSDEAAAALPGAPQPTGAVGIDGSPGADPDGVPTLVPGSTAIDGATVQALPTGGPTPTGTATGSPSESPSGSPTDGATASDTPTKTPEKPSDPPTKSDPPAPQPKSMAVSQVRATKVAGGAFVLNRVDVQLENLAPGAKLVLESTKTTKVEGAGGSGWACGAPSIARGTSSTSCTYSGGGGNGSFSISYRVANGARATATISPPAGFDDATASDNFASTALYY